MNHEDPITQFFPDQDSVDLYDVLSVKNDAKLDDIKKAYRRLALINHPDKLVNSDATTKAEASIKFQQIGFAYAVLSDERRKARYDKTGRTDEGFELSAGDDGWEAYFEEMFERVTRDKLDEMKKEYQGSSEEINDLKKAYVDSNGSIEEIMSHIPHSTHEDEPRFIVTITSLIEKGDLPTLDVWDKGVKDEKAKLVRKKQGEKEAKAAEKLARELGVWDEFYGSGKPGERKGKGKGKGKEASTGNGEEEEDVSALQALILMKKQKNMDGFFDSLAAKYAQPETSSKRKGKKREREDDDSSPKKKLWKGPVEVPEINDEEFEKLQQKLFGNKATPVSSNVAEPKAKKRTGRKAK